MDAGLGRGGIEAGLGRGGMPAWLGRGIPAGDGRWPPPETPNGLLPGPRIGGRAPPAGPGRPLVGAPGAPGEAGRPAAGEPGRGGTVLGPGGRGRVVPSAGGCCARRSASLVRAAWAARTAASCSAFSAEARASAAATSMSWALAGLATGPGVGPGRPTAGGLGRTEGPGAGAAGDVGAIGAPAAGAVVGRRGGVGRAVVAGGRGPVGAPLGAVAAGAGAPLPFDASRAPRSRRATGASTVLDADLTNSPISLSLARTVLLSTPSSLASSCTRALPGTALLTSRSCEQHPHRPHSCTRSLVISGTSSCAHVGRPTLLIRVRRRRPTIGGSVRHGGRSEVLGQRTGVRDPGETQRPPEGSASLRQREAGRIRMHMCPPARQYAAWIWSELAVISSTHRDEPQ
jgi:hypothetical protein